MRKILIFSIFMALLLSANSYAARLHHAPLLRHQQQATEQPAPQKTDIREIDNKFFSITLPEGWKVEKPVRAISDRVSAVFRKGPNVRIALNIFSVPFTNKLMAEKTAESMRQRGMEVSEPIEQNGLYVVDISKKGVTGKGWFGSNGKIGASTIIFAPDINEANELLEALKPKIEDIIPVKVD